jgi:hypothetical protein
MNANFTLEFGKSVPPTTTHCVETDLELKDRLNLCP